MSKAKVIHKDGLFVRKDKSRSSEWVRIIPCGEEFEFYEEYNGWLKVADGWVVCNDVYIKPTEVTAGGFEFSEGTRDKRITLYPETELTFTVDDSGHAEADMGKFFIGEDLDVWIGGGEKIELVFDDSSYIAYCYSRNNIGNSADIDGGLSYIALANSYFGVNSSYGVEDGSIHRVAIYMLLEEKFIDTPIDYKCIPTVVIDSTREDYTLCNKTFEEMCSIIKSDVPINAFVIHQSTTAYFCTSSIEQYGALDANGQTVDIRQPGATAATIYFKRHEHVKNGDAIDTYEFIYSLSPNNIVVESINRL